MRKAAAPAGAAPAAPPRPAPPPRPAAPPTPNTSVASARIVPGEPSGSSTTNSSTPFHRLNDRAANRRPNNGCVSATTRTSHGNTARNCCSLSPSLSGSAKPHLATALGHIAVRRRIPTLMLRGDSMFKRLKASRLDNSTEAEMRRLAQVQLLIIDDFALQPDGRHRDRRLLRTGRRPPPQASRSSTSNRGPAEWLAIMSDPLLAQSAVDRLTSTAHESRHQRNAKLQLTVLLAPPEAVPGLYLHPDHRRRRLRPAVRSEFNV